MELQRLIEAGLKRTKVWEAPGRTLKIFEDVAYFQKYMFGDKYYDFAKFYKDCEDVCPEVIEKVKLISDKENGSGRPDGLSYNVVIFEEFATEEQIKELNNE